MDEKLLHMLNGRIDIYPKNLEQQFPHIVNYIVEIWCSAKIDDYFTNLLFDNRGGRHGFSLEITSELFALSHFNAQLRNKKQSTGSSNPWDDVENSKRNTILQQGYDFSPNGFLQSAENGNLNAITLFLSSGIDINTRDARGWTPLMVASFNGYEKIARLLIHDFADIHAKDMGGYEALHWAAFNGHDNVVKLLIEKDADTNTLSNHSWTPLLQASMRGHLIAATHLIDGGANVNIATKDGWAPLHKAAANGHTEMVKLLLAQGANRNAECKDGTTPLSLATKNKHDETVALLTSSS